MPAELQDWSLGRLLSTAARLVERDWNHWLARHDLTHAGFSPCTPSARRP